MSYINIHRVKALQITDDPEEFELSEGFDLPRIDRSSEIESTRDGEELMAAVGLLRALNSLPAEEVLVVWRDLF